MQKAVKMRKVCEKPNGAFDNDNSYTICFSNKNLDNRQQARLERVGVWGGEVLKLNRVALKRKAS